MDLFERLEEGMHKKVATREQELALGLAKFYREPHMVGFWCGIIKRYGHDYVEYRWKQMADSIAPNSPRYLVYEIKKYAKK